jgi:hypothetical protein
MPQPAKSSAPKNPATVAATKAAPAASAPAAKAAAPGKAPTPAERAKMIADAAYFLAQKRGFGGGKEREDWLNAEKQVDELLKKRS